MRKKELLEEAHCSVKRAQRLLELSPWASSALRSHVRELVSQSRVALGVDYEVLCLSPDHGSVWQLRLQIAETYFSDMEEQREQPLGSAEVLGSGSSKDVEFVDM